MVTKAAHLKQIFSFHSLRVIDRDDPSFSRKTCFSDSEVIGENEKLKINQFTASKSKSETHLDKILMKNSDDEIIKIKSSNFSGEDKSVNNQTKTITHSSIKDSTRKENLDTGGSKDISKKEKLLAVRRKMLEAGIFKKVSESSVGIDQDAPISSDISSPYGILEGGINDATMNENLLGEPRSITLKKQSGDINPFLTDDALIFEPDFEDDCKIPEERTTSFKKKNQSKTSIINDMFLDDDEISSKKLRGDKEEGELSPEGPSIFSSEVETNETELKKKWDLEFFNKINECLRNLDGKCKEFYLASTPDSSITSLQSTLNNIDSIKRKLSYLLKTKRIESEKNKKKSKLKKHSHASQNSKNDVEQAEKQSKAEIFLSSDNMIGASSYAKNVRRLYENMILDKHTASDRDRSYSNRRDEKDSESASRYSSRRLRSSRDKPSQADLLNRKRISILEKLGTKQEIERIQSLFKRQMNLITQHVQKKGTEKSVKSSKEDFEKSKKHQSSQRQTDSTNNIEKISLKSLNTLEDMEEFLNKLKSKATEKHLTEQYLEKEKSKGLLKFSSKKSKTSSQNALLKSSKLSNSSPHTKIVKDLNVDSERSTVKEKYQELLPPATKNEVLKTSKSSGEQKEMDLKKKNNTSIITSQDSSSLNDQSQPRKNNEKNVNTNIHSKPKVNITSDLETRDVLKEADNRKDKNNIQTFSQSEVNSSSKTLDTKVSLPSERKDEDSNILKAHNIEKRDTRKSIKRKRGNLDSQSNEESRKRKARITSENLISSIASEENEDEDMVVNQFQKYLSQKEKDEKISRDALVKDLLSKKVVILDDDNFVTNNQFCIKVIGKEVYLKKVSNKRKRKHSGRHFKSDSSKDIRRSKRIDQSPSKAGAEIKSNLNEENMNTTLEEMENFLEGLRSKKIVSDHEKEDFNLVNPQTREHKFLARIQAKRKAKLMAHVSEGLTSTEKEAKFLKALKNQNQEISDSSDIEIKKQELMEKIRAETDAIVLADKPRAKQMDDDPLMDVKEFLNMLKEAESTSEEKSKQFYVSFSLKRSDVKKLENLATGKTSSLSEESQKLLNSVRTKMKAKKAPPSNISSLMQKPEV